MILGAVLAGGLSIRFGSDKALAEVAGHTLIAQAVDALAAACDHVIVVGRETAPAPTLPDWPAAGMGPLGGLAAALRHAQDAGYAEVLTCGVDSLGLPEDLVALLSPAPAFLADQRVIGLWPASAAATVCAILESDGLHSMFAFIEALGARAVKSPHKPANINTPADRAAAETRHRL